jgi:hypothetical protein
LNKVKNAFREIADYWHFLIGVFVGFISNKFLVVALFVFLVFLFYEAIEEESQERTVYDYITFILGFMLGIMLR